MLLSPLVLAFSSIVLISVFRRLTSLLNSFFQSSQDLPSYIVCAIAGIEMARATIAKILFIFILLKVLISRVYNLVLFCNVLFYLLSR